MSSIAITNAAEELLQKAEEWGFIYQGRLPYYCYIMPARMTADNWTLQLKNGEWVLLIDNIPQMVMSSIQALNFLARHYQKVQGTVRDWALANYFLEIKGERQAALAKVKANANAVYAAEC